MEEPMFYRGQRVVCACNKKFGTKGSTNPLIEGKSYYVVDPNYATDDNKIYIAIAGFERKAFWQADFIPYDTDNQLEEVIHEALKGNKILAD